VPVRRALGLGKRDRIRYSFRANGEVVLQRVKQQVRQLTNAYPIYSRLVG
jgi:bifunctional DNA-binding transcriptional regulator/antitoxin component of YhaV-PrlF toxin-antitoxin module